MIWDGKRRLKVKPKRTTIYVYMVFNSVYSGWVFVIEMTSAFIIYVTHTEKILTDATIILLSIVSILV